MKALLQYQTALLLRSQRWLPPVLLYLGLLAISLDSQSTLGSQLGWNAAALVPALAWLTRALPAAEPPAARACLAAAAGPRRPQYAALAVTFAVGLLLVLLASGAALLTCKVPRGTAGVTVLGDGLAVGLVCLLAGSALGAVCVPSLVRTTAGAAGALIVGSVLLLVFSGSPANAAVRAAYSSGAHFPALPLLIALPLAVVCWWVSAWAAGRTAATADREAG
ncbi:hypothetical protein ACIQMP_26150 [Streptomyces sp. NPDC091385]|uniref:hypothetical protein n=1 Tax=Streptomyces sp. NPDC091385 TaxID=3365997 RepID=UPI003805C66D